MALSPESQHRLKVIMNSRWANGRSPADNAKTSWTWDDLEMQELVDAGIVACDPNQLYKYTLTEIGQRMYLLLHG